MPCSLYLVAWVPCSLPPCGWILAGALAFRDVFTAGCSLYGVADLSALAADTHKFESRYLDGLVGKYPQDKKVYEASARTRLVVVTRRRSCDLSSRSLAAPALLTLHC